MSAVWARARGDLRCRVGSFLTLALVAGLAFGLVIAASAGARRTDSAFPRFLVQQRAPDAGVISGEGGLIQGPSIDLATVAALPQVAAASINRQFLSSATGSDTLEGRVGEGFVSAYARPRYPVGFPKILQGRLPDPTRADEVLVGYASWLQTHVPLGTRLTYRFVAKGADIGRLFVGDPTYHAPLTPPIHATVVGIGISPGQFPDQEQGGHGDVLGTPALYRLLADQAVNVAGVDVLLRRGQADVAAFHRAVERIYPGTFFFTSGQDDATVQRGIHVEASALRIFALVAGLAFAVIFGQALARQITLGGTENPTFRALGMTRGELFGAGALVALVVGVLAAAVAVLAAVALSPLAPIGVARVAEPSPGFALDASILVIGALAVIAVMLASAALPAWRTARVTGDARGTADLSATSRPVYLAGALARGGFPASAVAGVRMALEPGRGRSATPVRTTMVGLVLAVVSISAAFTFARSFQHLQTTPRLSGLSWDLTGGDPYGQTDIRRSVPGIRRSGVVSAISYGNLFGIARVSGAAGGPHQVGILAMDRVTGSIHPTVVEGTWPRSASEIALGSATLRGLGIHVGGTVHVDGASGAVSMRVVGRIVVPELGQGVGLGSGAGMTFQGLRRINPDAVPNTVFVDVAPGASPQARRTLIRNIQAQDYEPGSGIVNLQRAGGLPLALAAVVGLAAAATLVHTLVTSAYRRRRDLAILKTLGFVRRQVSATVAWQATTLVSLAMLIGIPLGLIVGRWLWSFFADRLGVVPEAVMPLVAMLLAVPAVLVLANLIAAVPGAIAAHTKPAFVLRSE